MTEQQFNDFLAAVEQVSNLPAVPDYIAIGVPGVGLVELTDSGVWINGEPGEWTGALETAIAQA